MREFLRRGGRDQAGLDDLARRVAERRREFAQKHNLEGTLQEVKELLDRALLAERKQLARDVEMDDADRTLAAFLRIPRPLYDIVFGREWFRDPAHVGPVSHDIFAGLTEHEDRAE